MNTATTDHTVRFVYGTDQNTGRTFTVAYMYDDENECIRVAKAECSKRDRFVKKIGRDVSFGRLVATGGMPIKFSDIGSTRYSDISKFVQNNVAAIVTAHARNQLKFAF